MSRQIWFLILILGFNFQTATAQNIDHPYTNGVERRQFFGLKDAEFGYKAGFDNGLKLNFKSAVLNQHADYTLYYGWVPFDLRLIPFEVQIDTTGEGNLEFRRLKAAVASALFGDFPGDIDQIVDFVTGNIYVEAITLAVDRTKLTNGDYLKTVTTDIVNGSFRINGNINENATIFIKGYVGGGMVWNAKQSALKLKCEQSLSGDQSNPCYGNDGFQWSRLGAVGVRAGNSVTISKTYDHQSGNSNSLNYHRRNSTWTIDLDPHRLASFIDRERVNLFYQFTKTDDAADLKVETVRGTVGQKNKKHYIGVQVRW